MTNKEKLELIHEIKKQFIGKSTFAQKNGNYIITIGVENWHEILKTQECIDAGIIEQHECK
jgi:hypothetical protein